MRWSETRQVWKEATVAFIFLCLLLWPPLFNLINVINMPYEVLARKWRSKTFCEVVGQASIVKSLQNAVMRSRVGHAYLFTGTRGTGKTSVARIFTQALRCENLGDKCRPCNQCPSCQDFLTGSSMNVLEIDGASNNSVENIRELIANVHYLPTSGRLKVYIIDEVHMLSKSAFNALLKTLEEPPEHVVFIFATTEPDKLLDTVLSRCQRFDFKNATKKDLLDHLIFICEKEGVVYDSPMLLEKIATLARGSFRDSLSLLEQVLNFSDSLKIDDEILALALGVVKKSALKGLIGLLLEGKKDIFSSQYFSLVHENISIKNIYIGILDHLFRIIQNFNAEEKLIEEEMIDKDFLSSVSFVELLWIYETLAKDAMWILSSIDPEKMALIEFYKICQRSEFFETEKNQTDEAGEGDETEEKVKPSKGTSSQEEKTWDDFLAHLYNISPASASNLEQGNVLMPVNCKKGILNVQLGFGFGEKVFYDYLQDKIVNKKLATFLAEYFEIELSQVRMEFILMDEAEKIKKNFKSKVEIQQGKEQSAREAKKKRMASNPLIKEAEKLFDSKVETVIIKKAHGISNDEARRGKKNESV